jgi:putative ribosome biogenesis GTPase RsgA
MTIAFAVNNLIQRSSASGQAVTERVLWLDEGEDVAFVIEVEGRKGVPQHVKVSELKEDAEAGQLVVLTEDKWARVLVEQELSDKQKSIRDKAWEIIEPLVVSEAEPDIFNNIIRGSLIKEAAQKHGVTVTVVYKYLRRFWQRGKVKNALLPDYENSGAPAKREKQEKKSAANLEGMPQIPKSESASTSMKALKRFSGLRFPSFTIIPRRTR